MIIKRPHLVAISVASGYCFWQTLQQHNDHKIVCSIVASRLDYCNAMLYGAPAATFNILQQQQNKWDLIWLLKFCRVSDNRIVAGSLLHDTGPATANARSTKLVIERVTWRSPCTAEQRQERAIRHLLSISRLYPLCVEENCCRSKNAEINVTILWRRLWHVWLWQNKKWRKQETHPVVNGAVSGWYPQRRSVCRTLGYLQLQRIAHTPI